ncbi:hypothetical protein VVMO6_01694 [Vibrio vulnificus MO6-24/O]|nr:hypothetical protein VVMO6_01694 [Vibrio vulnificus MO6-24/O]
MIDAASVGLSALNMFHVPYVGASVMKRTYCYLWFLLSVLPTRSGGLGMMKG